MYFHHSPPKKIMFFVMDWILKWFPQSPFTHVCGWKTVEPSACLRGDLPED